MEWNYFTNQQNESLNSVAEITLPRRIWKTFGGDSNMPYNSFYMIQEGLKIQPYTQDC
uniref:Uncharacterized protein n=1 Tax=Lotus japonicus TaxID=34305 RepID=I3SRA6_LOTJA|nr:unknown [Lotus japonicus]